MLTFFNNIKPHFEYLPLLLLPLLLISEEQIHGHALITSLKLSITVFLYALFFILCCHYNCNKMSAIIIIVILYILMTFFRKRILTNL